MRLTYGSAPLSPLEILEICLTILCIVVSFARPGIWSAWFARIEQVLRAIAHRRWLCFSIVGLLPIVLRLLLLPVYGVPTPYIHDEFSYLLQADTFASGRLTNPTPPLPRHFESVYIFVEPTYASEYQPAQAVALAIGQKLSGYAWTGVVVSMGIFCALLYWALLAWIPSIWAFAGAGITSIGVGVLSYWMNGYWGGCVPAIGGALALGALPRLRRGHPLRYSVTIAAGLIILLNSRPLEGALLAIIIAGVLLHWLFITKELPSTVFVRRILPAMALLFGVAIALMGYYNYRVTGHAAEFPYLLYRQRYGMPQGFFWQKTVNVDTSSMPLDIKAVYESQIRTHEHHGSIAGVARATVKKIRRMWEFYVGVPLTVALLFLPFIWRERNMHLPLVMLLVVVGLANLTFFEYYPHYSAPVAVLIVLALVQSIRRMRASGRAGLFLSRSLPCICVIGLIIPMSGRFLQPFVSAHISQLWHDEFWAPAAQAKALQWLNKQPGKHLVMVRYIPLSEESESEAVFKQKTQREDTGWIYNLANLDTAKVVWARELDPESNRRLLKCFPGRKVWLVEPDQDPVRLLPYSKASL